MVKSIFHYNADLFCFFYLKYEIKNIKFSYYVIENTVELYSLEFYSNVENDSPSLLQVITFFHNNSRCFPEG